jgi:hypothetical protein
VLRLAGMILLACPFLNGPVRLSAEREAHLRRYHDDFGPALHDILHEVLNGPDEIRWSDSDPSIMLFWRWYPELVRGKYVAVVVVLDSTGSEQPWIITAYVARRMRAGVTAWRRS